MMIRHSPDFHSYPGYDCYAWQGCAARIRASTSPSNVISTPDLVIARALVVFTLPLIIVIAVAIRFVWKRFWRLSQRGVFEAMLAILAAMSGTAHLVQMVDSTIVRAHVSAAGAKGGSTARRSAVRAAGFPPRST